MVLVATTILFDVLSLPAKVCLWGLPIPPAFLFLRSFLTRGFHSFNPAYSEHCHIETILSSIIVGKEPSSLLTGSVVCLLSCQVSEMAVSELPGNPNAVWTVRRHIEGKQPFSNSQNEGLGAIDNRRLKSLHSQSFYITSSSIIY